MPLGPDGRLEVPRFSVRPILHLVSFNRIATCPKIPRRSAQVIYRSPDPFGIYLAAVG